MTVTPTLSLRPDAVVLRWFAQVQLWWQMPGSENDAHLLDTVRDLDDRTLRDIGLEHLMVRRYR